MADSSVGLLVKINKLRFTLVLRTRLHCQLFHTVWPAIQEVSCWRLSARLMELDCSWILLLHPSKARFSSTTSPPKSYSVRMSNGSRVAVGIPTASGYGTPLLEPWSTNGFRER